MNPKWLLALRGYLAIGNVIIPPDSRVDVDKFVPCTIREILSAIFKPVRWLACWSMLSLGIVCCVYSVWRVIAQMFYDIPMPWADEKAIETLPTLAVTLGWVVMGSLFIAFGLLYFFKVCSWLDKLLNRQVTWENQND